MAGVLIEVRCVSFPRWERRSTGFERQTWERALPANIVTACHSSLVCVNSLPRIERRVGEKGGLARSRAVKALTHRLFGREVFRELIEEVAMWGDPSHHLLPNEAA